MPVRIARPSSRVRPSFVGTFARHCRSTTAARWTATDWPAIIVSTQTTNCMAAPSIVHAILSLSRHCDKPTVAPPGLFRVLRVPEIGSDLSYASKEEGLRSHAPLAVTHRDD